MLKYQFLVMMKRLLNIHMYRSKSKLEIEIGKRNWTALPLSKGIHDPDTGRAYLVQEHNRIFSDGCCEIRTRILLIQSHPPYQRS